jgi:hypothetical protein
MKFITFSMILLFLSTQKICCQDMKKVKEIIKILSASNMHGRGYVKQGDKKAAKYIESHFKSFNLKKFNQSYFQHFDIEVNTFPTKITLQIGEKRLKVGEDFIVNEISFGGKGKATLWILDSTYLQNQTKQKQILEVDFSDKMLVIEEKFEEQIFQLPIPIKEKIFTAKAILEILKRKKTVAHIAPKPITPPYFKITQNTWQNLKVQLQNNKNVYFEVENQYLNPYITQNVMGYVEGTEIKDTFLLAFAHYDHLGRMGQVHFGGANDNASGVSLVLSLAEYFKNKPLKYSIAFILFSGEELGLLGSKYFVENSPIPLKNIKFAFNFDIVGTGDDGATIVNSTIFTKEFEKLKKINEQKKYLPALKTRGKTANSDHHYFVENGVKAFYLYTMGGVSYYHDIYDAAKTLPLTKFQGVFQLVRDFFEQI